MKLFKKESYKSKTMHQISLSQKDGEFMKISPSEHKFMFMLFEGNCHLQKTGRCSLTLTNEEVKELATSEKYAAKNSVNYCRSLCNSLREKGQLEEIKIAKFDCGHYAFEDGQHRTCVSKWTKIDLNARIENVNSICNKCINPQIDARLY